jgi:16S rRNA (guanine(527)-N(7))-methyltransferase RsmG
VRPEIEIVRSYAASLTFPISSQTLERLNRYLEALLDWGTRINLVGSVDARSIVADHFCDAAAAVALSSVTDGSRIVDVGSGAGLPGIPIAIMRPDLRVTLVEAMRKRCAFLDHVRALLATDWKIVWARAESLARNPEYADAFDVAFERAVAPIERSARLVLPLVSAGGLAVFMKGSSVLRRTEELGRIMEPLGGHIEVVHQYDLPNASPQRRTRVLVLVRKVVR